MGESIMARRYRAKLAAERLESQLAADADARATLDAWHRDWLDRRRAAARLGIAERTLKAWQLARRGPAPVKFGTCRQSRVAWRSSDIVAFLADPAAFERAKLAAGGGESRESPASASG